MGGKRRRMKSGPTGLRQFAGATGSCTRCPMPCSSCARHCRGCQANGGTPSSGIIGVTRTAYIHTYIHTYMHSYIYMHTHIHTYIHT